MYTREEWSALTPEQRGPCQEWKGAVDSNGYGIARMPGRRIFNTILQHRVAWMEAHGPVPPETPNVLHHCDNPPCYNVEHLFLGTIRDNNADRSAKGRTFRPPSNPELMRELRDIRFSTPGWKERARESSEAVRSRRWKLTWDDVHEMRNRPHTPNIGQELASEYGVSIGQVYLILDNKQWTEDEFSGGSKVCSSCEELKPLESFHRRKASPDGRRSYCVSCRSEKGSSERKLRNRAYADAHGGTDTRADINRKRWQLMSSEQQQDRLDRMLKGKLATVKDWSGILELRESGATFKQIAKHFNSSVSGAHDAYVRLLKEQQ